jgi:hypothetical protein
MSEGFETLDLTNYSEANFDPVPPGRYFASIDACEMRETKNDGATPAGTPMIWMQVNLTGRVGEDDGPNEDSDYYGKKVFRNLVIPPADHDRKKAANMNGAIISFFRAVGFSQEEMTSGTWKFPDLDELEDKELIVSVNRSKSDYAESGYQNNITGYRSMDEAASLSGGSSSGAGDIL